MRRHLRTLGILAAVLLLTLPVAAAYAGTYVLDDADVIDAATETRIEELSARVEADTPGAEIAVVTVDSLDGLEIEEYAEEKFDELGVGSKKLNNGVLLLVAPNERKVRIEVGYGLEGAIPDARAGRIIDDIIIPAFKAGDMAGGIEAGHAEIARLVLEEYNASTEGVPVADTSSNNSWMFIVWLVLGVVGFIALMVWMGTKGYLKNGGGGGWRPPGPGGIGGGSTWGSGGGSSSGGGGGGGGGGFGGGGSGGGGASGGW